MSRPISVREKRLDLGVLQAQVAAHLGVADSTFSRYESGQWVMSAAMLCLIAAYLRQPITALIPDAFTSGAQSVERGDSASDEHLQWVTQMLRQRPDLTPAVIGLLETLLADEGQQALPRLSIAGNRPRGSESSLAVGARSNP